MEEGFAGQVDALIHESGEKGFAYKTSEGLIIIIPSAVYKGAVTLPLDRCGAVI